MVCGWLAGVGRMRRTLRGTFSRSVGKEFAGLRLCARDGVAIGACARTLDGDIRCDGGGSRRPTQCDVHHLVGEQCAVCVDRPANRFTIGQADSIFAERRNDVSERTRDRVDLRCVGEVLGRLLWPDHLGGDIDGAIGLGPAVNDHSVEFDARIVVDDGCCCDFDVDKPNDNNDGTVDSLDHRIGGVDNVPSAADNDDTKGRTVNIGHEHAFQRDTRDSKP